MDSSVQCFTGWHIPLALLSIAVLLACIISIAIVIIITVKVKFIIFNTFCVYIVNFIQRPEFIKKCVPPLMEAYKKECKWWAGVDLGRRSILLMLLVISPRNTVSHGYILVCK